MSEAKMSWTELFPDGREIFYEGDDPKGLVKKLKAGFDFDPSQNNPHWKKKYGYKFFCPANLLDEIYGKDEYEMGS
jgi:hypothetical protein